MKFLLRPARPEDAQSVAALSSELGYAGTPEIMASHIGRLLEDASDLLVVAVNDADEVIGWLSAERRLLLQSGDFCEITGLVVDPRARRFGVAKALVERAESWACDLGLDSVRVRSRVTRSESHPFYASSGYTLQKTQHCYGKDCKPSDRKSDGTGDGK